MNTSPSGISRIERYEGCRLTAYLDKVAVPPVWTIGWGDTQDVREGMTITQQEADERLMRRLATEFEPAVNAVCTVPTTQPQFDAMVSLAYNIGVGVRGFPGSSVARWHKTEQYALAGDAFRLWDKAGGKVVPALVRRRDEERALYLSGIPAPTPQPVPGDAVNRDLLGDIIRAAQRVVGVTPDGQLGPQTFAAVKQAQQGPA